MSLPPPVDPYQSDPEPPESTPTPTPPQPYPTSPSPTPPYPTSPYPESPYPQGPPPGQYGIPSGHLPYPAGPGLEPYTALPYSDKSKMTAGLLQLLLALFLALGGIGRLYAGHTTMGATQLVLSVVGWAAFWCGFVLVFPFFIYLGLWVWFVVDGIVMLAGRSLDGQGRPLR